MVLHYLSLAIWRSPWSSLDKIQIFKRMASNNQIWKVRVQWKILSAKSQEMFLKHLKILELALVPFSINKSIIRWCLHRFKALQSKSHNLFNLNQVAKWDYQGISKEQVHPLLDLVQSTEHKGTTCLRTICSNQIYLTFISINEIW